MFCDLVNSTKLATSLDAEDFTEILVAYQQTCVAVIETFRGYVAQFLGDGILVYFGFPHVHEDDAQRAVAAGLAVVAAVHDLGKRLAPALATTGEALAARVGVHSGVVVATQVAAGHHRELLAIGDTPNIASRLQSLAAPGEVAVAEYTMQRLEGFFDFRSIGAHELRGVPGPQNVYVALRQSSLRSRFEQSVARGLLRFQNREAELAQLHEVSRGVERGNGALVQIEGESGIGKSRFVHRFLCQLTHKTTCLSARCHPHDRQRALRPIGDWVLQLAGCSETDDDTTRRAKIARSLSTIPKGATASAAAMLEVMSATAEPVSADSADRRRENVRATAVEMLLAATLTEPLLLVLEDAQWCDPSSLEVVSSLVSRMSGRPILILLTRHTGHSNLVDSPLGVTLKLDALSPAHCSAMVREILGPRSADTLVTAVTRLADGVPLFAEELARSLARNPSQSQLDECVAEALPDSLHECLMQRLDALTSSKHVAQVAAVLGRDFQRAMLLRLIGDGDNMLDLALAELLDHGLILESDERDYAFTFKHRLVRDVAYASLLRAERRDLHERIAELVLREFPRVAELEAELVAHHFEAAGDVERALRYWLRAAQRSADNAAYQECLEYVVAARRVHAQHTLQDEHWREQGLQIEMLAGRAASIHFGYASNQAMSAFSAAFELCQRFGESMPHDGESQLLWTRLMCATDFLNKTQSNDRFTQNPLFWIVWGFGAYHQARAEHKQAAQLGARLLELAGDKAALQLEGFFGAGSSSFFLGDMQKADELLGLGWECFQRMDRGVGQSPTGHNSEVHCHEYHALTCWHLGQKARALELMARSESLARESEQPLCLASVATTRAWLDALLGDFTGAAAAARESVERCEAHGFGMQGQWARLLLLWALFERTQTHEALDELDRAVNEMWASDGRIVLTFFCGLVADASLRLGRFDRAEEMLDRALQLLEDTEERFWEPELWRISAQLQSRVKQDPGAADRALQRGIEVARAQHNVTLHLRLITTALELRSPWATPTVKQFLDDHAKEVDVSEIQVARDLLKATWR